MALTLDNFKSVYLNALSRSNPSEATGSYLRALIESRNDVILAKINTGFNNFNNVVLSDNNFQPSMIEDSVYVIKFNALPAQEFFENNDISQYSLDNVNFYDGGVENLKHSIFNFISERYEPYDLKEDFLNNMYLLTSRMPAFDLYYGTDTQRVRDVQRNRNIYVKAIGTEGFENIYIPIVTTGWQGTAGVQQRSIPSFLQNNGFPSLPSSAQNLNWMLNHYYAYQYVGGVELKEPIVSLTPFADSIVHFKTSNNTAFSAYILRQEDILEQLRWLGISRMAYTEEQATTWAYEDLPDTGTDEAPYEPPTQTESGQPDNVVINTGGTGDRTSDDISDYNPRNPAGAAGTGGSVYALNWKQMELVRAECWNTDFIEMIKSLNNNPASSIISCQLYPLDLSEFSGVLPKDTPSVVLGSYEINFSDDKFQQYGNLGDVYIISSINGVKATITENYKLDGIYGSFLDFEPYTKMKIYLPYVGLKEISPQHVFNKTLKIYYNIDIATGMCKAIIESDGLRIYEWKADIAVDISLSSSNFGSIKQNAVLGSIGAAVSMGSAVATGGMSISGLMDSGAGEMVSTVKNSLGAFSTSTTGSTGSSLERMDPQGCYLLIEYVESAVPTGYNHTYGRPSLITTTLNTEEMKGYCEIADSHFEIPNATESEKNEIENIFKEGVIIR